MTAHICPTCGRHNTKEVAPAPPAPSSNHRNDICLTIPEEHLFIFKLIFRQMNVKFGMMGLGEFANILPDYSQKLPIDGDTFRHFDGVKLAQLFLGIQHGCQIATRIEPVNSFETDGGDRMKVTATLAAPDGHGPVEMVISESVPEHRARKVCDYIEDANARLSLQASNSGQSL